MTLAAGILTWCCPNSISGISRIKPLYYPSREQLVNLVDPFIPLIDLANISFTHDAFSSPRDLGEQPKCSILVMHSMDDIRSI